MPAIVPKQFFAARICMINKMTKLQPSVWQIFSYISFFVVIFTTQTPFPRQTHLLPESFSLRVKSPHKSPLNFPYISFLVEFGLIIILFTFHTFFGLAPIPLFLFHLPPFSTSLLFPYVLDFPCISKCWKLTYLLDFIIMIVMFCQW